MLSKNKRRVGLVDVAKAHKPYTLKNIRIDSQLLAKIHAQAYKHHIHRWWK